MRLNHAAAQILAILALAGCASTTPSAPPGPPPPPVAPTRPPPPVVQLPANGPILYTCANGAQMTVNYRNGSALVAIIGGVSMSLPAGAGGAYSNGRYTLRESNGRAEAQWSSAGAPPTLCRGS